MHTNYRAGQKSDSFFPIFRILSVRSGLPLVIRKWPMGAFWLCFFPEMGIYKSDEALPCFFNSYRFFLNLTFLIESVISFINSHLRLMSVRSWLILVIRKRSANGSFLTIPFPLTRTPCMYVSTIKYMFIDDAGSLYYVNINNILKRKIQGVPKSVLV